MDGDPWTGTGDSLRVLPGEGGGERADTGLTVPTNNSLTDPISGNPVNVKPGTPGIGWGNAGDWGTFLTDLKDLGFGDIVKGLFGGKYGGQMGQMAAFGGLAALLNQIAGQQKQAPVGYQGGIPQYTVSRQQLPYNTGEQNELLRLRQAAQDAMGTGATQEQVRDAAFRTYGVSPSQFDRAMKTEGAYRRPGLGGIDYFTPTTYTATGKDLAPAAAGQVIGGGTIGVPSVGQPSAQALEQSQGIAALSPKRQIQAVRPISSELQKQLAQIKDPEYKKQIEEQLKRDLSPEEFNAMKSRPGSVLNPSFTAALEANLRGKEELKRRGIRSKFGSTFKGTTPEEVKAFNQALMIEKPIGGHITTDNDLNRLLQEYMAAAESGNAGRARGALSRMSNLGLGVENVNKMINVLDPEFNSRLYNKFVDPNTKVASSPLRYRDYSGYFTPGSSGWKLIAQDKARYGYSDEDIAYGMGMSVKQVQDELASVPAQYKKWPPGAASGGYMPSGIAVLARGGNVPRYLRGPGDGVSDDIAAKFDRSGEPARLADGEFVIDARTVSEIGNGSSEAGARKLYAMMDRVHALRKKAKRGKPSGADRVLNKLVKG